MPQQGDIEYSQSLELDLADVEPSVAGPKHIAMSDIERFAVGRIAAFDNHVRGGPVIHHFQLGESGSVLGTLVRPGLIPGAARDGLHFLGASAVDRLGKSIAWNGEPVL